MATAKWRMFSAPKTTMDCFAWNRTKGRLSIRKKISPVIQPRA
jgi:hypothetical protein